MRYLLSLVLIVLFFNATAQEQRLGDTTATGIATYSLRAINGKGTGNRPALFDSTGKLIPGAGSVSGSGWALNGNAGINATTSFLGTTDSQPLVFKANNNEGLRIISTGQVAVGASSNVTSFTDASYKLSVYGSMRARKVRVDADGWADYVFGNTYKLPTLKEVEAFIQLHKHLPDVPSAEEVGQNGIDLGDNQAMLLKKIEELTLYAIEQNKIIEKQNNKLEEEARRNRQLEERIKKLEERLK